MSGRDFRRRPLMLEYISERSSLTDDHLQNKLLEVIKKGNLIGYVQCDIEVPKNLTANFAIFSPIFRNTLVSKNDIGDLMKADVEE